MKGAPLLLLPCILLELPLRRWVSNAAPLGLTITTCWSFLTFTCSYIYPNSVSSFLFWIWRFGYLVCIPQYVVLCGWRKDDIDGLINW